MHIVLISACEKRALKRSRAILDSYALRAGDRTWASAITIEGLRELRTALKRVASRHTAVACYRNEGMRRMKLLWVVGSPRHFGPNGHFPAGTTRRKQPAPAPVWVRQAALLADAAGQGHDVGKATIAFQRKLRDASAPQKDSIRHEWVSLKVIQALRAGADWPTAWRCLEAKRDRESIPFSEEGLSSVLDVFDFLVVTHHGLFGPRTGKEAISFSNHVRADPPFDPAQYQPYAPLPDTSLAYLNKKLQRLEKIAPPEGVDARLYWRALALIARAGLIFADHYISSLPKPKDAELYANTKRLPGGTGRKLDQSLDQHLSDVSGMAGQMTYRLATLRLPGLSEEAVERIMERTDNPLFAWQNHATAALENARSTTDRPALVLNLAGTGAGKTRMNAKCACALAQDHRVRFATALNLRTLTLQTGDAYREQLRIGADELACIIGDRIALQLHESAKQKDFADEDENPVDVEFDAVGEEFFVPAWVEPFIKEKPLMRPVIGAPVLASTVDFLIAAGEPQRQGNHILAMLRLIDSDLILDEIDSYDPKGMVAVLRLVQIAGLFGRNVISSSATLARPVALALYRAYQSGIAMRAALHGRADADFVCALLDDRIDPEVFVSTSISPFEDRYQARIERLLAALQGQSYRIPILIKVSKPDKAVWQEAIADSILQLHADNAWTFAQTGKRVSFGLVRMANIRPAIETARFLTDHFPNAHVACYHSQDFTIQRSRKEKQLDRLLTRKNGDGNGSIEMDSDIRDRVSRTDSPDVIFIVVATPVEEIGRDHDFDWAVIEPSSTQSIVQTAGRVNRHRLLPRTVPNIAILQVNFRKICGKKIVFTKPGLETDDWPYNPKGRAPNNHNLKHLIDWSQLPVLDAGLRFRNHPFAELDDRNLTEMIKPLEVLLKPRNWMVEATYADYPLRDKDDAQQTWRFNYQEAVYERFEPNKQGDRYIPRSDLVKERPKISINAWLCWTREELAEEARNAGISLDEAFRFSIRGAEDKEFEWDEAFGAYQPLAA